MTIGDALFNTYGRIRRRDFWLWMIAKNIGCVIIFVAGGLASSLVKGDEDKSTLVFMCFYALVLFIYVAGNVALLVKRWHDRGKTGWMYLILLIPIVGVIWTLIECGFLDGTQGRNRFGRSPKGIEAPQSPMS